MNKAFIDQEIKRIKERAENTPTIVKVKKVGNYVSVDNKCVSDTRLSWKAKGLLVYLLSKPEDWKIYLSELSKHATDKRTAITSGMNELEKYHYLYKEKKREPKTGRFVGWIYWIFEKPEQNPKHRITEVGKPEVGKPEVGKPATTKID